MRIAFAAHPSIERQQLSLSAKVFKIYLLNFVASLLEKVSDCSGTPAIQVMIYVILGRKFFHIFAWQNQYEPASLL